MAGSSRLLNVSWRNSDWKWNPKCCWFVTAFAFCCFLFKHALWGNLTSAPVKTQRFLFVNSISRLVIAQFLTFSFQTKLSPHLHVKSLAAVYHLSPNHSLASLLIKSDYFFPVFSKGSFRETQKISVTSQPAVLNPDLLQVAMLISLQVM